MLDRDQIVKNGCAGTCCARFHFGFTIEDLYKMKKARNEDKFYFTDSLGNERRVYSDPQLEQIAEMLVYIDDSPYSAESGELISASNFSEERIRELGMYVKDGEVYSRYFTCKHFDTENKICTIYETRPNMCRNHGVRNTCGYKGCGINQLC